VLEHHSFGVDLVGQAYELDLRPGAGEASTDAAAVPAPSHW
jgi:hypothetical protein